MSVQEGDIVKGVVSDITNFGAFVKLETGEKGLVHISEIADTYVRNVSDYLGIGDEITVRVIAIKDRGKIDLSLRRLKEGKEGGSAKAPPRKPPVHGGPPRTHGGPPRTHGGPPRAHGGPPRAHGGPPRARGGPSRGRASRDSHHPVGGFEDKLTSFLKKSQDKLTDVKKRKEKRSGGRRR